MRADCYIEMREYFKAIMDIKATTKLVGDNTAAFYRISDLHYQLGEADDSLRLVHVIAVPRYKPVFPKFNWLAALSELGEIRANW